MHRKDEFTSLRPRQLAFGSHVRACFPHTRHQKHVNGTIHQNLLHAIPDIWFPNRGFATVSATICVAIGSSILSLMFGTNFEMILLSQLLFIFEVLFFFKVLIVQLITATSKGAASAALRSSSARTSTTNASMMRCIFGKLF